jgi:O-antigen/teichoic acid export membrane protein
MASLSDKAGFLIGANLVKYAVGFITPMVLVRMLDRADYGTYQQLALIGALGIAILVLGLPNSVYYFHDRKNPARDKVLTLQTSAILLASGLLTAIVLLVARPLIVRLMGNQAMSAPMPWYVMALGLLIATEHFVQFMIARDRYRIAVLTEVAETVIRVLILVLPLLAGYGLMGLVTALFAYAFIRFVVRTAWLIWPLGGIRKPPGERWFMGEQLEYAVPLGLMSLVGVIGGYLDRGIVATRFAPADYAIYSVGALEIPLDAIFQASVATVLRASMPALIRDGRHDEVIRLLREGVRKLSLIMLPCFVFLQGFAYEFITVLFTPQYARSVGVFRIYLFLMPLNMFILSPVPPAYGRTRINFQVVAAVTVVHVILSFLLLHWIGFYGPALSAISTSYLLSTFYFIYACKLTGGSVSSLLPLGTFVRVLGCAGVAVLVARLALGGLLHKFVGLVAAGALFSVVFFGLCMVAGVFTPADRALARRWLGRFVGARRHKQA